MYVLFLYDNLITETVMSLALRIAQKESILIYQFESQGNACFCFSNTTVLFLTEEQY